ncbi:hypothetical protein AB0I81_20740 [Nonomuraea sp. NPDC050404]|uniref:hypothetical protein n=1 Tax=Nonomuraea sp. NPDC050404 TaxID=3155783 RepID=UPI0033F1A88A
MPSPGLNSTTSAPAPADTAAPSGPKLETFSAPDNSLFCTSPGPLPATYRSWSPLTRPSFSLMGRSTALAVPFSESCTLACAASSPHAASNDAAPAPARTRSTARRSNTCTSSSRYGSQRVGSSDR